MSIITLDQIAEYERRTGLKYKISGKICDFCNTILPASHQSKQCTYIIDNVKCPTIYDICFKCILQNKGTSNICHRDHTVPDQSLDIAVQKALDKESCPFNVWYERHCET